MTCLFDKSQSKLIAVLLFFLIAAFSVNDAAAVIGTMSVTDSGKPLPSTSMKIVTDSGTTISESKTDDNGKTSVSLPPEVSGTSVGIVIEGQEGAAGTQMVEIPKTEGPVTMAVDKSGGAIALDEPAAVLLQDAARPMVIGANGEVGSGARTKQKIKETAGGMFGGAIGGLFGGMVQPGSGDSSDQSLNTVEDHFPREQRRIFRDPATGVEIGVGAMMTPRGLLVSTTILNSPDDGTFQTVFLQDPQGRRAGPVAYYIYELYSEWSLTVSWTYDRWVDGQHVEHREGGWSEGGRDLLGSFRVPAQGEGIWKQLGFSNAVRGIRSLGVLFPLQESLLKEQLMTLVVHISRPSQDIVSTVGFSLPMPTSGWTNGPVPMLNPF